MREQEDEETTVVAVPRTIVSYNVSRGRRGASSIVYQYVFGRKVSKKTKTGKRVYRYPGLVNRAGVEVIGQSVLMMKEKDAEDVHSFLWSKRVSHTMTRVWVEP
jgi:hypothetical protein